MIVDDEPELVEILRLLLSRENYECLLAYDGNQGLECARIEKPDLVILDVMLPGMNGYKVSRLLKFDEQYRQIPIIMLTAKADSHDRLFGEFAGANYYITKPFSTKDLAVKVKEPLGY